MQKESRARCTTPCASYDTSVLRAILRTPRQPLYTVHHRLISSAAPRELHPRSAGQQVVLEVKHLSHATSLLPQSCPGSHKLLQQCLQSALHKHSMTQQYHYTCAWCSNNSNTPARATPCALQLSNLCSRVQLHAVPVCPCSSGGRPPVTPSVPPSSHTLLPLHLRFAAASRHSARTAAAGASGCCHLQYRCIDSICHHLTLAELQQVC